jgi:hypothetical protein
MGQTDDPDSGRQAPEAPASSKAFEHQPIMHPVRPALPELDALRPDPPPSPVLWSRDPINVTEPTFRVGECGVECCSASDFLAVDCRQVQVARSAFGQALGSSDSGAIRRRGGGNGPKRRPAGACGRHGAIWPKGRSSARWRKQEALAMPVLVIYAGKIGPLRATGLAGMTSARLCGIRCTPTFRATRARTSPPSGPARLRGQRPTAIRTGQLLRPPRPPWRWRPATCPAAR